MWSPIDTCPKDGRAFLAYYPHIPPYCGEEYEPDFIEPAMYPQDAYHQRYYGMMIGGVDPIGWSEFFPGHPDARLRGA